MFFSNLNSNCSNSLDIRNLNKQVKKAFCYQKLFRPFTVYCSKGQIISECPCETIVSPKIPNEKVSDISALASKESSNQKLY